MNLPVNNINRLAVILIGEFRTWKIASKYLINFFSARATQVDYFFVTWNVTTQTKEILSVTDADIVEPFNAYNGNLVDYKILEPIGRHNTTYYNQAWLAKFGNMLKRKYEQKNNFVYDQVVETRPDCYFRKSDTDWKICKDFEYEGACPRPHDNGFLGIHDVYFRTTSFTNDLLSNRYKFEKSKDYENLVSSNHWEFTNHHWTMSQVLFNRLLNPISHNDTGDFTFFCCVRPNFPTDKDLDQIHWKTLDDMFVGWGKPYEDFFYGPRSSTPIVNKLI